MAGLLKSNTAEHEYEYDAIIFCSEEEAEGAHKFCKHVQNLWPDIKITTLEDFGSIGMPYISIVNEAIEKSNFILYRQCDDDFLGFTKYVVMQVKMSKFIVINFKGDAVDEKDHFLKSYKGFSTRGGKWEDFSEQELERLIKHIARAPEKPSVKAPPTLALAEMSLSDNFDIANPSMQSLGSTDLVTDASAEHETTQLKEAAGEGRTLQSRFERDGRPI